MSTFGLTKLEHMIRKITETKSNISELRKNLYRVAFVLSQWFVPFLPLQTSSTQ